MKKAKPAQAKKKITRAVEKKQAGPKKKPSTKKSPEVPESAYRQATWFEFLDSGLLLFVNMFLHIFGWCIVLTVDETGNVTSVHPARTSYRGFSEASIARAYVRLSELMDKEHGKLLKQARS